MAAASHRDLDTRDGKAPPHQGVGIRSAYVVRNSARRGVSHRRRRHQHG
eukprot:CAMPEP_0196652830 /NCGR_PEP_ID=MMETSP1086-20130531/2281_1 /TAXON_ID=77921 /ORGANISM="Cyanoptyche  gloeocystis , Strain SAG4.97" /LENGTH=48 /DNA_ID= /DNA_START= /DNA_END= /DNA_ORIENTATION=